MDNIRPFRNIKRRKSKTIYVGKVAIGGDNPISVQSMTNTLTTDVKGTIIQISELAEAGADIVRVSCPDKDSTLALKEIVKHSSVPIIADIHFHYERAIEAAKSGASCLRINPGNIGSIARVIIGPIIGYLIILYFNLSGYAAGVLLIQCSMPSAVLNYLVGSMYSPKKVVDNIASMIVVSTLLSFITIPIIVFLSLKYFF